MHDTAYETGRLFFQYYFMPPANTIVELGSYDVNGTLRDFCPTNATYVGLDLEAGPGVDVVLTPHHPIPLSSDFADLVVSSSAFEHDDFFWETFLELVRITKPGGFIYLSAPSNGKVHRHPADNWRFYPDASKALEKWAIKSGMPVTLVEPFIGARNQDIWNDFVAVFCKGEFVTEPSELISDNFNSINVRTYRTAGVIRTKTSTEDMDRSAAIIDLSRTIKFEISRLEQVARFIDALVPRPDAYLAVPDGLIRDAEGHSVQEHGDSLQANDPPNISERLYPVNATSMEGAMIRNYGEGVVHQAEGSASLIKWVFLSPGGWRDLWVKFASAEPRPLTLLLNGVVQPSQILADTTGGWYPEHQKWAKQIRILLNVGENSLSLASNYAIPHVSELALCTV